MLRVIFPKAYEICEGHEWHMSYWIISAEGVTEYKKEWCRHCGLEVERGVRDVTSV